MPEHPNPKLHGHPWRERPSLPEQIGAPRSALSYVELAVTSNFSFLRGGSHPEEMIDRAAELGYHAIALADRHTLAGMVRAHVAAKERGIQLIVGSRVELLADHDASGGPPYRADVLLHVTDTASYACLCRLLTTGKRRAPKGECHLTLHDLLELLGPMAQLRRSGTGLLCTLIPPAIVDQPCLELIEGLHRVMGDALSIAVTRLGDPDDALRSHQLRSLANWTGVPLVAVNDVHYHVAERRPLQDILTCIRYGCTIDQAGYRLFPNAERHLKSPQAMAELFADMPEAIQRAHDLAERAVGFSMDQLRYRYPAEVAPPGVPVMQHLRNLTWAGARDHYPHGITDRVRKQLDHELTLIEELQYAPFFLTVHDLVVFARSRHILCQGRGAAANSAVCYCLGITAVDPDRIDVLFERFVSKERNEPPDIDVDFEHERREEVIQYLYQRYGRERAALVAEVVSYRGRSAIRDVGKALGLSLDCVDQLASGVDWWHDGAVDIERVRTLGLDPRDPTIRRLALLTSELLGFPRHLSQHVGGFVITDDPLCELVPIENAAMDDRTIIEWDKDDIEAMGMLKVDVLALGMLTCIRKAIDLVNDDQACVTAVPPCAFHTIPAEDPVVYDMICAADTVGVFQIESRAQMSMLPRLRPRCFYDLVIEVAIVRPGPIQGDMVHPYLRRRNGEETITYPDAAVERVLGKTLGVPLFQEQAMSLAIVAAGFTPGEADQLRRAIAAWKRKATKLKEFAGKLEEGMVARGYTRLFAQQVFTQIQGFSGYGFPESHAASFALLVYVSSWLKCHHPAAFAAALLNSQPMGFYAPAQIVRDAEEHGVTVRAVDVNASTWDCSLERHDPLLRSAALIGDDPLLCAGRRRRSVARQQPALRLGLRLVKGLAQVDADRIAASVRCHGSFTDVESLWRASGVSVAALRRIAAADAFRSMGLARQQALWQIRALRDDALPMFVALEEAKEEATDVRSTLPRVTPLADVAHDYAAIGLSRKQHPIACIRANLAARGASPCSVLMDEARTPFGTWIAVAGVVLVRQRPSTAHGILFMTLEDETGIANLIVRPQIYERFRTAARHSVIILARGTVERSEGVVHILVQRVEDASDELHELQTTSRDFH
ncbi:MAG: error-prone DNA polymerase [Phycisphaerae bacterium]|nr:error-prone DNA polymerase [Phycisphaerae bacterium]